ncbi:MAG: DMT family transporter, partial [Actinobacteria bacterium]|nr:DMT family transporter [Actinomycetota bacterium]
VIIKAGEKVVGLEILSAFSGVLIAAQSRVNGALSDEMGDSLEAAIVSFSTGLLFITLIAVFRKDVRAGFRQIFKATKAGKMPPWTLAAGVLGASFVAMQTHVVPIVGVALFTVASLAGQTAISLWVDKLGLSGGAKSLITKRRVIAAIITVIAVLVSVIDKLEADNFQLFALLLALIAGALVGVQRALNGQINGHSQNSYTTSLLNFITGTSFLTLFIIILIALGRVELDPLPIGPWWIYTGGVIGVIYIAATSLIVQHLGVLTFTLFSVGGQLIASLLLDIYSPTQGVSVSWYLVSGIAMTYIGVLVGGVRQSRLERR